MVHDGLQLVRVDSRSDPYFYRIAGEPTLCRQYCTHLENGKQRTLTVHHLDGDKSNRALWNLAALCQVCHLQVQGRVCWDQGWLLEHSPWMIWHLERYERRRARAA